MPDLIMSLMPEDGSSIGNGAMIALLRETLPDLKDGTYARVRDTLVDEGLLGRGRGRGGSIFRIDVSNDDGGADERFELTPTEHSTPRQRHASGHKKPAQKAKGPVEVLSYRHGDTRVNNPEVGMVHAGTDPDGDKTVWAYDPHLDPVLNFDSARAGIERLIDDALASDDPERMR
ncbi:site-specific DNA-methyltransferase, partial [Rhodovulum sulfidophilum]|nr:site-specific DNA-methyltransferase [Rhodovulum sulfidophilum]